MDSSKTTTLGIVLIFVVFIGWLVYMNSQQAKLPKPKPVAADTARGENVPSPDTINRTERSNPADRSNRSDTTHEERSGVFATTTKAPEVTKTIETPYFTAQISSNGAAISDFQLRGYKTWDGKPVDLVNHDDYHGADVNLKFVASDGKTVATNDLAFILDPKPLTLGAGDSMSFSALYRLDTGRTIEKIFHVSGKG